MSENKKYISSYLLFFVVIVFLVIYSSPNYSGVMKDSNNIKITSTNTDSYSSLNEMGYIEIELERIPLGTYTHIDLNNISLIYFLPFILVVVCFIFVLFSSLQFFKKNN